MLIRDQHKGGKRTRQWKRSDGDVAPEKAMANPVGSPMASSACGGSYMKPILSIWSGNTAWPQKECAKKRHLHATVAVLERASNLRLSSDSFPLAGHQVLPSKGIWVSVSPCPRLQGSICRNMAQNPIPLVALSSLTIKTSSRSSLCNLQQSKFSLPLISFL